MPGMESMPGAESKMAKLSTSELKGRKLGRALTKMGKVTREQVHEALAIQQQQPGRKIGQVLVELGYITEADVQDALAGQAGIDRITLRGREITDEAFEAAVEESRLAQLGDLLRGQCGAEHAAGRGCPGGRGRGRARHGRRLGRDREGLAEEALQREGRGRA